MRMRMIIFEGIASSGKTTLARLLKQHLVNAESVSENDTLMTIFDNRDPYIALDHLQGVFDRDVKNKSHVVIIDRFHLTHAFRTVQKLDFFEHLEDRLAEHGAFLVLLTIRPEKIEERIIETTEIRKDGWTRRKKGTIHERVEYYIHQQEQLRNAFLASKLPKIEIDTTDKEWKKYLSEIVLRVS